MNVRPPPGTKRVLRAWKTKSAKISVGEHVPLVFAAGLTERQYLLKGKEAKRHS
jgi:hypothetical protein